MTTTTTVDQKSGRALTVVLVALLAGAAVAVAIGVYGKQHQPTGQAITTLGFGSMIAMKVWLGSIAGVLALGQLVSALWMYGKLGRPAPRALGLVHRFSGGAAVVISLPVAYHCLWALGFQSYDTRVLVHSLFGCIFYGAFVTKVIALHTKSGPGWLLPLAGGTLLTALVVVVLASSVWYLTTVGAPPSAGGY
jgi:predicted lysophospholipase L1 biosynthesis ABC-type transport system permease subunit